MKLALKALAAALTLLSLNAFSGELIDGSDPAAVENVARGFGSATLEKDSSGDPKVSGRINGTAYGIYFYGCTENKACDSIQFSTGWARQNKIPMSEINEWNAKKRFGKAYLDNEGDPRLEMDVNLDEGVSRLNLEDTMDYWSKLLDAFKQGVLKE